MKKNSIPKNNILFPENFLWGTATSAHQIEGFNTASDWWCWEHENAGKVLPVLEKKFKNQKFEPSGKCLDHYNLYKKDFDLIEKMHNNAFRMSIEWARIEPSKGNWDLDALSHYKKVLQDLKRRNIQVMLTLHHFTNPKWFAEIGGWTNFNSPKYFKRYASFVAKQLGQYVDFWVTLNEPDLYGNMSYQQGFWPPQEKDNKKFALVYFNMARAHRTAYKTLHKILDKSDKKVMVGIAQNVMSFTAYKKHSLLEMLYVHFADRIVNHAFFDLTKKHHDFLGINFYYRVRLGQPDKGLFPKIVDVKNLEKEVSDMDWLIYPHGLFSVLMDMKDFNLPIYVTENGVATENDKKRERFLTNHLIEVHRAIQNGADVRGYFHWSLLDNFEWDKSFGPKFGLVEVDRRTFKRKPKPSFYVYKKICEDNGIVQ